ncbi:MAG: succinyldiaminopimelate aminotransferase [Phycisphaeraceae bacterium]|nr:succinyldiaminopimelate aminotransferase [Phycisphaeraceae bacterium]
MSEDALFERLWDDYVQLNPDATSIRRLIENRGERIVNDHIALRTFDDARVGLDWLAAPFERLGYRASGEYDFTAKKLNARHYEMPSDPNDGGWAAPKVFISALRLDEFSPDLRRAVSDLLDQASPAPAANHDDLDLGRPWNVSFETYERLRAESEYAAWVAAFGFRANHFTVLCNALSTFEDLAALNAFLKTSGFELNGAGGEIKGSPEALLEQSSTLAPHVDVEFSDGTHRIPGCYYEFARRYPGPDGSLFQGFVAKSADRIFQSTDRR